MTIQQKQHLLAYLGYYRGTIDGIWGPQSAQAAARFQEDWGRLAVDGIAGEKTQQALRQAVSEGMPEKEEPESFWEEIHYFSEEEFRCKCGGRYCNGFPARMHRDVVKVADRARAHFGGAGDVISGLRCPVHNSNCGGAQKSRHMTGKAIDLRIRGVSGESLLAYVKAQPEIRYAYQINETNVHLDVL